MGNLLKFLQENKFNLFLFFIYVTLTVILALHHEMWRDETQVWCIIRDCNLPEFFKIMKTEGHPLLWYIINLPFVKLNFPAATLQFTGLVFSYLAALYLLIKAPFNKIAKTLILFSSAMLYFFPIVTRNFTLIPILLFIMAEFYQTRKIHPYKYSMLLILLSNTHFLVLCFCFINMIIFISELVIEAIKHKQYKNLSPIIPLLINAIYLYLFYGSTLGLSQSYYTYSHSTIPFFEALQNFALIFFQYPFINPYFNTIFFYTALILLMFRFLQINKKIALIFFFSVISHFYIFYKVWFNGILAQKAYLLIFILIFCFWIISKHKQDKILNALIIIIFFINSVFSIYNFKFETEYNYSGAKETAQYIKQNLNEEITFCTIGAPYLFTSISAYLPDKKLFSLTENKYTSYYDFSRRKKRNKNEMPDCNYYIVQKAIEPKENHELVFETTEPILSELNKSSNEAFKIYKRN